MNEADMTMEAAGSPDNRSRVRGAEEAAFLQGMRNLPPATRQMVIGTMKRMLAGEPMPAAMRAACAEAGMSRDETEWNLAVAGFAEGKG